MKSNLKPCKVCWKLMPKGLNNVCSPKCAKEKEKLKKKEKESFLKIGPNILPVYFFFFFCIRA